MSSYSEAVTPHLAAIEAHVRFPCRECWHMEPCSGMDVLRRGLNVAVARWVLDLADEVEEPPGPISDRLRADSEALARHGAEQELDVPGETRD